MPLLSMKSADCQLLLIQIEEIFQHTLLNITCCSYFHRMQLGCEDDLETPYAIKLCVERDEHQNCPLTLPTVQTLLPMTFGSSQS